MTSRNPTQVFSILIALPSIVIGCQAPSGSHEGQVRSEPDVETSERITFDEVEGGDEGSYQPSSLCELLEESAGGVGAYEVTALYAEPQIEPYVIHAPLRRTRDLSGDAPSNVHFQISGGPDPKGDGTSLYPSNELVDGETVVVFLKSSFDEIRGTARYKATQERILRDPEGDGTYANEAGLFAQKGGSGATLDEVEDAVNTALQELEADGECTSDVYPRNWQSAAGADTGDEDVDAGS